MAIGKLGRVMEHKNRRIVRRSEPRPRGREVTRQDIGFADSVISKESIGSLRVRPVLASPMESLPPPCSTTAPRAVAVACHGEHPETRIPQPHCLSTHPLLLHLSLLRYRWHKTSAWFSCLLLSHELVIRVSNGLEAEYSTSIPKTVQLVGN